MPVKKSEGRARGTTKPVDSLIGIAHREHTATLPRKRGENLDLREVGILKFVHQDETGTLAFLLEQG